MGGLAWAGDWARWPPEVPSKLSHSGAKLRGACEPGLVVLVKERPAQKNTACTRTITCKLFFKFHLIFYWASVKKLQIKLQYLNLGQAFSCTWVKSSEVVFWKRKGCAFQSGFKHLLYPASNGEKNLQLSVSLWLGCFLTSVEPRVSFGLQTMPDEKSLVLYYKPFPCRLWLSEIGTESVAQEAPANPTEKKPKYILLQRVRISIETDHAWSEHPPWNISVAECPVWNISRGQHFQWVGVKHSENSNFRVGTGKLRHPAFLITFENNCIIL